MLWERVVELLDYNPETGNFHWRKSRGKAKAGAVAGKRTKRGCLTTTIDGKEVKLHRLAWFYVNKRWPDGAIDHANHDPTDNRISNLREATATLNLANTRLRKDNGYGLKGVTWVPASKKWSARITANGQGYYLGLFETREEAHAAYQGAARVLFGKFACFDAA